MYQKHLIKLILHIPIILLHQFDKTLLHHPKYPPHTSLRATVNSLPALGSALAQYRASLTPMR